MSRWQCPIKRKAWRESPKGRYAHQKNTAKYRGIEFKLSFDEWWDIWQASGKWDERGSSGEHYCMCRKEDLGAYELGNVRIDTHIGNLKESHGTGGKARSMSSLQGERSGQKG